MINVIAYKDDKTHSAQLLKEILTKCTSQKNSPLAFISLHLRFSDFLKFTKYKSDDIVSDYTERMTIDHYLNASLHLPLSSKLFLDLPDKSFYRNKNECLNMRDIRRMIIPLKYRHQVKNIYVDDFSSISLPYKENDTSLDTSSSKIELFREYNMAIFF